MVAFELIAINAIPHELLPAIVAWLRKWMNKVSPLAAAAKGCTVRSGAIRKNRDK